MGSVQRAFLRDRAERESLSKESVFLPLRLCLRGQEGSATPPRRSSDVHCWLEPLPRAAELSGLCCFGKPLRGWGLLRLTALVSQEASLAGEV
jgi:hypothetical protein